GLGFDGGHQSHGRTRTVHSELRLVERGNLRRQRPTSARRRDAERCDELRDGSVLRQLCDSIDAHCHHGRSGGHRRFAAPRTGLAFRGAVVETEAAVNGPLRPPAALAAITASGLLAARAGSLGGGSAVAGWVLLVAFAIGLPVAMLVYAFAHRRVGVIVLALCLGLSVNVVYVANAVPANAAASNTNQFWFNNCCTQTFACPSGIWDLLQSSAGLTSNTSRVGGTGVSYTYCSDTFTSSQSLQANTTTANLY